MSADTGSNKVFLRNLLTSVFILSLILAGCKVRRDPVFSAIAFYGSGEDDRAHASFVQEATRWFALAADRYNFRFDTTSDWNNLNRGFLSSYDVMIFLDSRPDSSGQRQAFREFMESGGAWMGFHFAAFALDNSEFPQNWDWYHNEFLGSGEYLSNTWRPTSAMLKVENRKHPSTINLPGIFRSSPNEWYRWENDLRSNPDIDILLSIDTASFPLGTGPKKHEIWYSGFYPVVWTNRNYRMLYLNMGHNDIDYDNGTNSELSLTFGNKLQDRLISEGLLWLGSKKRQNRK